MTILQQFSGATAFDTYNIILPHPYRDQRLMMGQENQWVVFITIAVIKQEASDDTTCRIVAKADDIELISFDKK